MTLYPLLLIPDFRERVWGARDLAPFYNKQAERDPIGEVWLTGEDCAVANGPLAGRKLKNLAREYGRELVGEAAPQPDRFPLLIKFLFPREKLSVQVHPDDEGARRLGQPCGKTECWYVLAAEPGAQVGLGLKPGVTHADFKRAIHETRAEELMNWIDVQPGELVYVDAGTVHAIGPGSILVETQQNSDTTYRLYDYGRPRELHIEQGLQAMKETTRAGKVAAVQNGGGVRLVESPSFVVERFRSAKPMAFAADQGKSSVQIVVATGGGGVVEAAGQEVAFARGEAVVVPAEVKSFRVRPQWELEMLVMRLPAAAVAEPKTSMVTIANAV